MKLAGSINTPWGRSDSITKASDGVVWVTTPSHGGVHLSAEVNAEMPEYMRSADGWYEEDCKWCLPVVALGAARIAPDHNWVGDPKGLADIEDIASQIMRTVYRKAWERFTLGTDSPFCFKLVTKRERLPPWQRVTGKTLIQGNPIETVRHSHGPVWGRLQPHCPRCDQLRHGAPARVGRWPT